MGSCKLFRKEHKRWRDCSVGKKKFQCMELNYIEGDQSVSCLWIKI